MISMRKLTVRLSGILLLMLGSGCSTASQTTIGTIAVEDPAFFDLIPRGAGLEVVAEGFEWSEGPAWSPDGYLLFSDIPKNTIYKWAEGEGLSVYLRPAGHAGSEPPGEELGTNGLAFDADGSVIAADHGNRGISRIDGDLFTKTMLASDFEGKRLNSPNDLVFNKAGDIYFTDPPYGLKGLNNSPLKELDFNGVYLLRRDGSLSLLTRDLTFPNGIALSPDENTLYVAVSDGSRPIIMAYAVQSDGTVDQGRIFFDGSALTAQGKRGAFDGLTVDVGGNLFATGPGGVLVITPEGKLLGTLETGQATSNVTFGGPDLSTLYITADMYLLRIPTNTRGIRSSNLRGSSGTNSTAYSPQQ